VLLRNHGAENLQLELIVMFIAFFAAALPLALPP
jgi:hypothetical protein